mgnify:CR=1 FL=1
MLICACCTTGSCCVSLLQTESTRCMRESGLFTSPYLSLVTHANATCFRFTGGELVRGAAACTCAGRCAGSRHKTAGQATSQARASRASRPLPSNDRAARSPARALTQAVFECVCYLSEKPRTLAHLSGSLSVTGALSQRLLAVHHAGARLLAQRLHLRSRDVCRGGGIKHTQHKRLNLMNPDRPTTTQVRR